MREHWARGLRDIRRSLAHEEWLALPGTDQDFATYDLHRYQEADEARD